MKLPAPLLSLFLLSVIWAGTQVQGYGQELRTNARGEKIIVYPDGSARYFNDLTLIEAQRRDSAGAAYPVIAPTIDPLARRNDPTDADLRRVAERKLTLAGEALDLASTRARAAQNNRLELESQLRDARAGGDYDGATVLQRRLLLARQVEVSAVAERTAAEQRAAAARLVVSEGRYADAWNEARRLERFGPATDDRAPRGTGRLLPPARPRFTGYGTAGTTLTRAADSPCRTPPPAPATAAAIQPRSYPQLLFSYTDENLRPFFEGKEYLSAYATVGTNVAGERTLEMTYVFSNPNALTNYGFLAEKSSLSLHLLNGKTVSLQAEAQAVGIIDHAREEVTYRARYPLPRGVIALLRGEALDYVRVYWSAGFEEYPVYRVEVLRGLMECW